MKLTDAQRRLLEVLNNGPPVVYYTLNNDLTSVLPAGVPNRASLFALEKLGLASRRERRKRWRAKGKEIITVWTTTEAGRAALGGSDVNFSKKCFSGRPC